MHSLLTKSSFLPPLFPFNLTHYISFSPNKRQHKSTTNNYLTHSTKFIILLAFKIIHRPKKFIHSMVLYLFYQWPRLLHEECNLWCQSHTHNKGWAIYILTKLWEFQICKGVKISKLAGANRATTHYCHHKIEYPNKHKQPKLKPILQIQNYQYLNNTHKFKCLKKTTIRICNRG